jgi:hypothetical protein
MLFTFLEPYGLRLKPWFTRRSTRSDMLVLNPSFVFPFFCFSCSVRHLFLPLFKVPLRSYDDELLMKKLDSPFPLGMAFRSKSVFLSETRACARRDRQGTGCARVCLPTWILQGWMRASSLQAELHYTHTTVRME